MKMAVRLRVVYYPPEGNMSKAEWKCPRCEAPANACGKDKPHLFNGHVCNEKHCSGFLCECDHDTAESHGETADDPCKNANCYHCGWGGEFPLPPFKLKGWAKKAWDAGWRPPAGWTPIAGDA